MEGEVDPRPRTRVDPLVAGIVAFAVATPAALVLLLLTALTANACGMFADGCDDDGKTAPGFLWFALGAGVASLVAFGGLVVAVFAFAARRRR